MSVFNIDHINTVWRLLLPPDKRLPKWQQWGAAILAGKQWKHNAFFTGYMTGASNLYVPTLPCPPNVAPAAGAYISSPTIYSNISTTYNYGNTIIYAVQGGSHYYGDNAVYQFISTTGSDLPPTGTNVVPDTPPSWVIDSTTAMQWMNTGNGGSPFLWVKVQDNFIGASERAMYNASRLVFEYALNKWFYNSSTHYRDPVSGNSDINIVPNVRDSDILYMGPAGNGYNFIPAGYGEAMPYLNITSVPPSTFDFSIHFPVAIYNDLVSTSIETAVSAGHNSNLRDSIVMAFADKLNVAGMTYNIITY